MSQLEYCLEQLKELINIAKKANEPMLVYLLELAIAEAFDEINRRRNL